MIGFNILSTTVAGAYGGWNGGSDGGGGGTAANEAPVC